MRVWIDTEFNGFEGELISIGMVAEDGQVLYCVRKATKDMDIHPWVQENVIPHLSKTPLYNHVHWDDDFLISYKIQQFFSKYSDVEVIADWPDDIRHLCNMMITGAGYMITTPRDFVFKLDRSIDTESSIPHNAIYDAIANMEFDISRDVHARV